MLIIKSNIYFIFNKNMDSSIASFIIDEFIDFKTYNKL
jgi:hypothetical protein